MHRKPSLKYIFKSPIPGNNVYVRRAREHEYYTSCTPYRNTPEFNKHTSVRDVDNVYVAVLLAIVATTPGVEEYQKYANDLLAKHEEAEKVRLAQLEAVKKRQADIKAHVMRNEFELNNEWLSCQGMPPTILETSQDRWRHPHDVFRAKKVQHRERVEHEKKGPIQVQYARHASGLQVHAIWCELFGIPGEAGHGISDSRATLPT